MVQHLSQKNLTSLPKEWCIYSHRKERILVFLNEVGKDADGSFRIVDGTCFKDSEGESSPLRSAQPKASPALRFALIMRHAFGVIRTHNLLIRSLMLL
jgi:hypothetical protein